MVYFSRMFICLGDKPLDLSCCQILAMDWKNDEQRCQSYVIIKTKALVSSLYQSGFDKNLTVSLYLDGLKFSNIFCVC